jgi:hypothetical protein
MIRARHPSNRPERWLFGAMLSRLSHLRIKMRTPRADELQEGNETANGLVQRSGQTKM